MKKYTNNIAKYILTGIIACTLGAHIATPVEARTQMDASILGFVQGFFVENSGETQFPSSIARAPISEIWVLATAYSSDPNQTDDTPCITANGHDLCEYYDTYGMGNTVAANFMPFETTVTIPDYFGDKEFKVRDRMNARYGYGRIDIWMPSYEQAKAFGVRYIKMNVYN